MFYYSKFKINKKTNIIVDIGTPYVLLLLVGIPNAKRLYELLFYLQEIQGIIRSIRNFK